MEPSAADETAADAAREASAGPSLTRRGRVRKFDRPPPPKDWRWWVSGLGKTLIAAGLLMFGFVAYQLWGTGIENARAQASLENEFEQLLAETPPVETSPPTTALPSDTDDPATSVPDADTDPSATDDAGGGNPAVGADEPPAAVPVEQQNIPDVVEEGDPIARLEIPRIGADDIVVAGVTKNDLKKGPGHYPETPLPGQLGNAAIAGHRTTYGQPFFDVDKLEPGDEIIATTLSGRYVYRVTDTRIVSPSDYWVVATTDPGKATITLTSCHPKWTARERIIIVAELDDAASTAVGAPVVNYGQPVDDTTPDGDDVAAPADTAPAGDTGAADTVTDGTTPTGSTAVSTPPDSTPPTGTSSGTLGASGSEQTDDAAALGSEELNAEIADAFSEGWFSDPGANGQVLLWGLLLAAVGIVSYLISKTFKRDWVGALVGIVPFIVVLYFFFQNVNRLLPPNL